MTSGRVVVTRKPLIWLHFLDVNEDPHLIPMVLDTGFTGQALLPERYVARLGLTLDRSMQGHLANGEFVCVPTGDATVIWQGERRSIQFLQLGTEPLLGMDFLWNHRISIDAITNGPVTITPLVNDRMGG